MLDWLTGRSELRQRCAVCRKSLPVSHLVFVNHCYHKNYHRRCAGNRLLCSPCHLQQGPQAFSAGVLSEQEQKNPDQYPWELARAGMVRFLGELEVIVQTGVDPGNESELEQAWRHNRVLLQQ